MRFSDDTLRQIARDEWLVIVVGLVSAAGPLDAALAVAALLGSEVALLCPAYLSEGAPELGVAAWR